MVRPSDVHAKHKFFLKDLSAWFKSEDDRTALRWERNATRSVMSQATDSELAARHRNAYVEGFCFAYDTSFYDHETGQYTIDRFLDDGETAFGGYDVLIFWQPFPRIGIDERNQFDFWRDMPGGLDGLRQVIQQAQQRGIICLLNYIPWDSGTRREAQSDAALMAELLEAVGADGIFGDTMSGFPPDFVDAFEARILECESVPPFDRLQQLDGVWVQDVVLEPHRVPLPRWITPERKSFAVNRQISDRRELIAQGFFMGMGIVTWENVFGWWNPFSAADRALIKQLKPLYLAHAAALADPGWEPLPVETPGLHANRWQDGDKTVITLLNTRDEDILGASLFVPESAGHYGHYDVWHGKVLDTRFSVGDPRTVHLTVDVEALSPGCIVIQPIAAPAPIFSLPVNETDTAFRTPATAADLAPPPVERTPLGDASSIPADMVHIPGGTFTMQVQHPWAFDQGGCYDFPGNHGLMHRAYECTLPAYLIDQTEVTNQQYWDFLQATQYCPKELHNFLRHWTKPEDTESAPQHWQPPEDKLNHPVVWVDLDDARAYCRWAEKRLPTEAEWQYAAQGNEGRTWPWGSDFDTSMCNSGTEDTTPVDNYPQGASPFGCLDMSGNIWEWTDSERSDGHTRYTLLRSGSYWRAEGSLWYVASGAQPCNAHQKLLLLAHGLDRCSTIGFRAVKDLPHLSEA